MSFSTPYLIYILAAYSLSICALGAFFCTTWIQWKKSKKLRMGFPQREAQ